MAQARPNIVCFVTDQQRADHLGCYGNPDLQTPHIDRLAREGIRLTESYVANPVCMPNRASLFTGQYPKAHGVRENGIGLSPTQTVLPEVLRQSGYQTASFGKLHLNPYDIPPYRVPLQGHETYETPSYWDDHETFPLPYYGLEEVYFTGGHGPYVWGDYKRDIGEANHALMAQENALVAPSGAKESWKSAIPEELHYNTRIADQTIAFLHERPDERPFFVWCSFPDPHHPYMPPAPYCDQYDPKTVAFDPARRADELDHLPPYFRDCREGKLRVGGLNGGAQISVEQYREIIAHTYGMIALVDQQVGRVMHALEENDLLDNTVVVFLSDHGDLMGDHWLINKGPFLFRGLVRVPTIWRLPATLNQGRDSAAFVSAVDFCPTILDLTGAAIPDSVQGVSYKAVLEGTQDTCRDAIYIEYDETYLDDRLRQIRTPEWALTYYAHQPYGLLYNLKSDPQECTNLWDEPDYQVIKSDLLHQLLRETIQNDSWMPPKKVHA